MTEQHSAGAVIFRKEKKKDKTIIKYLLVRYPSGEYYGTFYEGHWGLVKGLTTDCNDPDIKTTVIREIDEETGLKESEIKFIEDFQETIDFYYKRGDKTMHKTVDYFLVETEKKEIIISEEHQDFAWLEFEDVMKTIKFKNLRAVIEKARAKINETTKVL